METKEARLILQAGGNRADHQTPQVRLRLGRYFYKGVFEENINIMLAAEAQNFKRAMRLLFHFIQTIGFCMENQILPLATQAAWPYSVLNDSEK